VAAVYSIFTFIPLPYALVLWSIFSVLITLAAVGLLIRRFPELTKINLNFFQLSIITMSFFPWIEGFQAGQNHTLALFLVTCIVLFSLSEKWELAGAMAGFLIYKPQLVIGLLIIWIIWRKFKAITVFFTVSILCVGSYILFYGLSPIQSYLYISKELLLLPYVPGFPGYLLLTLYGLFATVFPLKALTVVRILTTSLAIFIAIGLFWISYQLRARPILMRTPAILLAIALPLVATPYVLLHDIVILIPGLILWNRYKQSEGLLFTSIGIYLGGLFFTLIASVTKIAFVSFLSIGVVTLIFIFIFMKYKNIFADEAA
jgi:hypothetical protein